MSVGTSAIRGSERHTQRAIRLTQPVAWRQPRVLVGLALIALSVVIGTLVVSSANARVYVWAAKANLAAGTQLGQDDLIAIAVTDSVASQYVSTANDQLTGQRITRDVAAGELVPSSAVAAQATPGRLLTVAVEPLHSPVDLAHGDRVDVYVSAREAAGGGDSRLVLADAIVAVSDPDADSASGQIAVVLQVPTSKVGAVVEASRSGVLDLVRVPIGTSA